MSLNIKDHVNVAACGKRVITSVVQAFENWITLKSLLV